MTKTANPAKKKKYAIELNGYDMATCQKITLSGRELKLDTHGDAGEEVQTANGVKYKDMVFEKLVPEDEDDSFFSNWFNQAYDPITGKRALHSALQKTFFVKLKSGEGNVIRIWQVTAIPKVEDLGDLGDMEEGNFMEKITVAVNKFIRVK